GSPPMNFLPGQVEGGSLRLPFVEVPIDDALRSRLGDHQLVICGIRPEHVADASVLEDDKVRSGLTFEADVDVTEWLGSELYAYVPFDTHPDVAAKLEELDRDLDGEGMRTQLIASLSSDSRVRDGDTATLWFDPARMMVFDPETGENLTRDDSAAEEIDRENEELRRASLERAQKRESRAAAS